MPINDMSPDIPDLEKFHFTFHTNRNWQPPTNNEEIKIVMSFTTAACQETGIRSILDNARPGHRTPSTDSTFSTDRETEGKI